MPRSSVQFVVLTLMIVPLLSGCARNEISQGPQSVRSIPQRIVSLTPNNTEILFALGLGDKVVGDTSRCNYPPEARKKPKIGDMNASIERVVAAKPDLVLANSVLNDSAVARLRSLKIPVVATDAQTFDDVISNIRLIGHETGAEKRAEEIIASMESAIKAAKGAAKDHPRMLVVAQASPLWTTGPKTFVDDMVGCIGAENIGADTEPGKFNQMSTETAVARNPDIIIVTLAADKSFFEQSSIWKGTNAARNHRVYVIDPDLIFRGGPRLAKGLEEMARAVREEK